MGSTNAGISGVKVRTDVHYSVWRQIQPTVNVCWKIDQRRSWENKDVFKGVKPRINSKLVPFQLWVYGQVVDKTLEEEGDIQENQEKLNRREKEDSVCDSLAKCNDWIIVLMWIYNWSMWSI